MYIGVCKLSITWCDVYHYQVLCIWDLFWVSSIHFYLLLLGSLLEVLCEKKYLVSTYKIYLYPQGVYSIQKENVFG